MMTIGRRVGEKNKQVLESKNLEIGRRAKDESLRNVAYSTAVAARPGPPPAAAAARRHIFHTLRKFTYG